MRSARTGKGLVRSLVRRGSRSTTSPPVARKFVLRDPTVCERCGAVYLRKSWRRGRSLRGELLDRAAWAVCPGCAQAGRGEYYGRVIASGEAAVAREQAVRRRIENVARRALVTQPERKLVSIESRGEGLEILTTLQKLAHRIVKELVKAFGGRASYSWSDRDGSLLARWRSG